MNIDKLCGWVPPERRSVAVAEVVEQFFASLKTVFFGDCAAPLRDSGAGKVVLLHKYLEAANGGTFPVNRQTIGDCVSHGWAKGVEVLMAVEILLNGEREQFKGLVATEGIYGSSRVEVGGGRLGNSDGSLGSWAAKAVKNYGTLQRQKYGSHDLTTYSGRKAKDWGYRGLPDELEDISREHPVETVSLVTTYEEARDAIANGYPVPVCSNQGFSSQRDRDGFARPSGSWAHCMVFVSADDEFKRPGLLCVNSWGTDWISGPKRHDQPDGSFWVDADTCNRMLRGKDSFAVSNFKGYPSRKIDHSPF